MDGIDLFEPAHCGELKAPILRIGRIRFDQQRFARCKIPETERVARGGKALRDGHLIRESVVDAGGAVIAQVVVPVADRMLDLSEGVVEVGLEARCVEASRRGDFVQALDRKHRRLFRFPVEIVLAEGNRRHLGRDRRPGATIAGVLAEQNFEGVARTEAEIAG